MSKSNSGLYWGTRGAIIDAIMSLPQNPDDLLKWGYTETTPSKMAIYTSSRMFYDAKNRLTVRFDKGDDSLIGFRAKDHYHVFNPNATGKLDYYLDKDGLPCPKGSVRSHIIVLGGEQ